MRETTQNSKLNLTNRDWCYVRSELRLSERELQVAQNVLMGRTLPRISEEMRLGLGTVKTYLQRIYRKLQISSQQELTLRVIHTHLRNQNRV